MGLHKMIDRRGAILDSLRGSPVSWNQMSRVIGPAILVCAAALGCSSAPRPNEMAPTPRLDPFTEVQTAPVSVAPVPASTNDGIAARINNDIITWKDVKEILQEIKPADLTIELKKSKLREMAEERMFLQAAKKNNLTISEQELDEAQRRDQKMYSSEDEWEKVIRI